MLAEVKEYVLPAWIMDKGQIVRMRWRHDDTGQESEVASADVFQDEYTMTLKLPQNPPTNQSIIIEARHYYAELTSDASSLIGPQKLIETACKFEALRIIFDKMGPAAKRFYAQTWMATKDELAGQEKRWLNTDTARDWNEEEDSLSHDDGLLAAYSEWI